MKIKDFGGEFAVIDMIASMDKRKAGNEIIKGIGDDCAAIKHNSGKYLLVTTDMMVENDHFCLKWQTPYQVGMKLMEVNVSDIVAMGGIPEYAFISISIKKDTTVEFMEELYKGLYDSAKKHNVSVLGGDTTHGTEYTLNATLIGKSRSKYTRFRSGAKKGDIICVTGTLGGSTAGLKLLLHGKAEGMDLKDHLEPKSRTAEEGMIIARFANSMIDVSDGLGSEVRHICEESKIGARIDYDSIPIKKSSFDAAEKLSMNAYDFALYGGEDFQIVFTITKENLKKIKKKFTDFTIIGEILDKDQGLFILKEGKKSEVQKGYDHFA
jgi:thiamine-monophosphate kinase